MATSKKSLELISFNNYLNKKSSEVLAQDVFRMVIKSYINSQWLPSGQSTRTEFLCPMPVHPISSPSKARFPRNNSHSISSKQTRHEPKEINTKRNRRNKQFSILANEGEKKKDNNFGFRVYPQIRVSEGAERAEMTTLDKRRLWKRKRARRRRRRRRRRKGRG